MVDLWAVNLEMQLVDLKVDYLDLVGIIGVTVGDTVGKFVGLINGLKEGDELGRREGNTEGKIVG
jgi:hypothetical protein